MRRKIIKGGKIADEIRQKAQQHHEEEEIPHIEAEMEKHLEELHVVESNVEKTSKQAPASTEKNSWWKALISALKHLFKR